MRLLSTPRIIFAVMSCTLSNFVYAQLEPTLTLRLDDFSLSTFQKGLVLCIYPLIYIPGTILTPMMPSKISKRFTLLFSCFLMGFFLLFVGPSQILGFDDNL